MICCDNFFEPLFDTRQRVTKEDAVIDWRRTAQEIYNRWRAHYPWPGSTAVLRDKGVKVLRCKPAEDSIESAPGTVLGLVDGALHVACGGGTRLALEEVQAAGKKPVAARDFVNGERLEAGERLTVPTPEA